MSGTALDLVRLLAPVEDDLERMRAVLDEELAGDAPAVQDMLEHLGRFRGKQLRGALVLLAGRAAGTRCSEHPRVAAIIELIHLATLVHDDVLDNAGTRRRVASVNERWDNQTAVLLGDLLYARAFDLSTRLDSRLASRVLSVATQRICAGEIEQARRRYDFDQTDEDYERVAAAKTAELYAAACELGARYPSGEGQGAEDLRVFGWEVGLAFQIIDDVLDVTGDAAVVGKPVGNDVEDGKVTLPVLVTYRAADETLRAAIRDVYTRPGLVDRAAHLRDVADLSRGVEVARCRADALLSSALERLTRLPAGPARDTLEQVGEFILARRN